MRSFAKINSPRNGKITAVYGLGEPFSSRVFFNVAKMYFTAFRENKILAFFFEFAVDGRQVRLNGHPAPETFLVNYA